VVSVFGQKENSFADSLLIGTWKGTSICQVKPSPCHNEIAVYHITKTDKKNTYHIVMNKVVNGREEDMAVYDYQYEPTDGVLKAIDEKRKLIWQFTVKDKRMKGVLVSENKVFRIIDLSRSERR
jgi:hypothetical protein